MVTAQPDQSFFQKERVKITSTVNSSRRPTIISKASTHLAPGCRATHEPPDPVTPWPMPTLLMADIEVYIASNTGMP